MQLRDWRLRKRLLFSNFIMIFIPVLFTVVVSIAIFLALQFGNINRASIISFIWPESGQNMSIQFELSRLRVRADQYNGNMDRLLQAADHLEDQGLNVSIWRDKEDLYDTDGIDKVYLRQQVMAGHRQGHADFTWTGEGLRFYYVSPHTDIHLAVAGAVPSYSENEYIDLSSKDILKVAFYVLAILTILLTILVGLKLSRWMAGQIVGPVERLRNMADAISQGDLDHPVPILSRDEIGDTCQAFEKMRLQLRAARDTREKYDKNRKELLAGISHDLSTPLTKIEGYASGILDGIANTPEKERHYLDMIVDTSRHMAGLVRTLFLFSKLDLGQVPFHWEDVDVAAYLKDYIGEQTDHFHQQGLDVTFQSSLDKAVISMDRQQFQRVIENILGNSLKYKDQAVGHLAIILTDGGEGAYLLSFADDGCGVEEKELPKLFESFYRTDKARTNVAKGSGLGLAELERDYLEANGFSADIAVDGKTGEKKALEDAYDLILLDIMLPGRDGFQICRTIRETKDIPILMVSARQEDIDKIRGLGLGADDYIVKPFSPNELVARVKGHLARYEQLTSREVHRDVLHYGDLEIDESGHRVFVKGKEVTLPNKEFELLLFFAKNPGIVFSKETLFDRVWGSEALGETATVSVHVNRIREKIEEDTANPRYIETVWGAGYRFRG